MSDHQDKTRSLPDREAPPKSSTFAALKDMVDALDIGEAVDVAIAVANAWQVIARKR